MVASVGISLAIQSIGWIAFGIQEKSVPSYLPGIVDLFGIRLPRERLLAAGVAVVLVAALYWLVYRTRVGLAAAEAVPPRQGRQAHRGLFRG